MFKPPISEVKFQNDSLMIGILTGISGLLLAVGSVIATIPTERLTLTQ